ncbi:MAG TPA: FAD binding domain-containing protein [Burkholderiales bacterium]|nr:FAD binding domain-containing protein [Burkholderiales bacterium]
MKAPAFAYVKPRSLGEVYALLEQHGDEAKILAGGQSLIATLNMRLAQPRLLIDIGGLAELGGVAVHGDTVRIGALTRQRELERSAEIAARLPLLAQALPQVAHAAIRNCGTFGGSIAFADPAAELPACALALDATFRIGSGSGERSVPARQFFKALYQTALGPQEVLLAAEFPALAAGYRSVFLELARRHGDYAIVGVAAHARSERGTLSDVRLAFLGVGATPVLATGAAHAMEGVACDAKTIAGAQAALAADLDPLGDLYHSRETKLHFARVLLGRALNTIAHQP